jgi:hypothetical protein
MKSLCGPSGRKLVTRKKLVFCLSFGPVLVATAYFRISFPVLVAWSSGWLASLPRTVNLAKDFPEADVENSRAVGRARLMKREAFILATVGEDGELLEC